MELTVKHKMPYRHFTARMREMLSILNPHMAGGAIEEAIRRRIKSLRERSGWTQAEMAKHLREALPPERKSWGRQSNVSKYELGDADADIDTVAAMAATFKVPLAALVPGLGSISDSDRELLTRVPDGDLRAEVLQFLEVPALLKAVVTTYRLQQRQQQQSGVESNPDRTAEDDGKHRKRGRAPSRAGGKRG